MAQRPLALVRAPAQRMMSALLYLEGFEQQVRLGLGALGFRV